MPYTFKPFLSAEVAIISVLLQHCFRITTVALKYSLSFLFNITYRYHYSHPKCILNKFLQMIKSHSLRGCTSICKWYRILHHLPSQTSIVKRLYGFHRLLSAFRVDAAQYYLNEIRTRSVTIRASTSTHYTPKKTKN